MAVVLVRSSVGQDELADKRERGGIALISTVVRSSFVSVSFGGVLFFE